MSMIHLKLTFVNVRYGPYSSPCIWISSCSRNICWRDFYFPHPNTVVLLRSCDYTCIASPFAPLIYLSFCQYHTQQSVYLFIFVRYFQVQNSRLAVFSLSHQDVSFLCILVLLLLLRRWLSVIAVHLKKILFPLYSEILFCLLFIVVGYNIIVGLIYNYGSQNFLTL